MNRIVKSICMVTVMALAFTACKKNDTEKKTLVFKGTTEQMVVVNDEPGAKVYLDAKKRIRFEQNDLITIFNIPDTANGTGTTTVSNFRVQPDLSWDEESGNINWTSANGGAFFAYYPGGYVNTDDINNPEFKNRVTFTLQGTQYYESNADGTPQVPKNALYVAAKNGTEHDLDAATFKFKNICGILGVRLYSPNGAVVKKIVVKDNAYHITGNVSMKIHEVDPDYMTRLFDEYDMNDPTYVARLNAYIQRLGYYVDGDECSDKVTLDCTKNGGVTLGSTSATATEFYIVMRPLALSKGSHMTVYLDGDREVEIPSTQYNCIAPNVIRRLFPMNIDNY